MPQFDLTLYFNIFIVFSLLFFLFNIFLNIFVFPLFWNIFYTRHLKKEYNIFYILLQNLQKEYLNLLNLQIINYTSLIFNLILNSSTQMNLVIKKKIFFIILKKKYKND